MSENQGLEEDPAPWNSGLYEVLWWRFAALTLPLRNSACFPQTGVIDFAWILKKTSINSMNNINWMFHVMDMSRTIVEAVSCWLPTAAARVRARAWQVGFVVDKVASGQVFSEYFSFPCQNRSFPQFLHHHDHPGQLAEALRRADHPSKESCRLS
jgi:hypothetical protein